MGEKNESAGGDFVITRLFDAPRELVFKAWTEPKRMAEWWGPRIFTTPVCQMDVRPGGKFRIVMRGPDGSDHPCIGVYRAIEPPSRLVFTINHSELPEQWHDLVNPNRDKSRGRSAYEAQITVRLDEEGGKTKLTLSVRFDSAAIRDMFLKLGMNEGWSSSLDKLADLLNDRLILITRVVDAPRELAWKAMTEAKHVIHWWGPRGFTTTIEKMDVRPGGTWKHVMHGPDGKDYPNHSVFKEVVEPERIVFIHGPGTPFEATWTFDDAGGGKTLVSIRMVFPTAADRESIVREFGAIEGGKQTLERLSEHLPTMSSAV
jgi:uncharacterized protein YndB with AHSA1/START domain